MSGERQGGSTANEENIPLRSVYENESFCREMAIKYRQQREKDVLSLEEFRDLP